MCASPAYYVLDVVAGVLAGALDTGAVVGALVVSVVPEDFELPAESPPLVESPAVAVAVAVDVLVVDDPPRLSVL